MIRQPLPLSYFEKVAKAIVLLVPDFFKKIPHDFSKIADKLLLFSVKGGKGFVDIPVKDKREIFELLQTHNIKELEKVQSAIGVLENHNGKSAKAIKREKEEARDVVYFLGDPLEKPTEDPTKTDEEKAEALKQYRVSSTKKSFKSFFTHLFFFTWSFNFYDKKIFRLEENLMNELLLTDVSRVDDSFLHLPFPTICFHIPYNNVLRIHRNLVEWAYVNLTEDNGTKTLKVFYISKKDDFFYQEFYFKGGDIEDQLVEQLKEKFDGSKLAIAENKKIFSLIISTLLYMDSEEVDETKIFPSLAVRKSESRIPICSLGRNIKINNELHGMYVTQDGEQSERMIHVLKWTVRGHFRRQKVGAGRLEVRRTWIRPFLKGKEKANEFIPAKPTNYIVS